MPKGIVTTGRGYTLNLDELIRQSETPIGQKPEKSTRERASYSPKANNKPKVRGFVPGKGEVEAPVIEVEETPDQEIVSAYSEDGKARKLSDLTGIRIDKPTRKAEQTEDEEPTKAKASDEEEEILGDMVKNLKTPDDDEKEEKKSSTRSRKKSS